MSTVLAVYPVRLELIEGNDISEMGVHRSLKAAA